ncbi:glucosamine-6-phosphate deaminase [Scytonema sp. NUACC21]
MPTANKSFRVDALQVHVYRSEVELAQDVAKITQVDLQNILLKKETAALLMATGNSQIKFLDALIEIGDVDWSRIIFFHLDEYLGISADHPASFRRYLRERLENRVQPKQFHYIEGDAMQPLIECDRYTNLLQAQPIDLCCLGVGENGHLAFNDPAVADFHDSHTVKLVKLDEVNRQQQVNTGYFPKLEAVPQYAFTVTIPLICSAQKIICLAQGKRKAKIVQQMLYEDVTTNCPASILRTQQQATLFLDVDSAAFVES